MTDKTPITSPSAPPAGPYSPGLAAGEWVFPAGQTGTGQTIEDQAEDALGKVAALLDAAGCAPADVVSCRGRPGAAGRLVRGVPLAQAR